MFADLNGNGYWDPIEPLLAPEYMSVYQVLLTDGAFQKIRRKETLDPNDSLRWATLLHLDTLYTKGQNFVPALGSYDFSWAYQPWSQPSAAVTITRTVQTAGGKATNMIIYGQTNANKVEIMAWAECQGVICQYPLQMVLPIIASSK
jgi:hypothetical protein